MEDENNNVEWMHRNKVPVCEGVLTQASLEPWLGLDHGANV